MNLQNSPVYLSAPPFWRRCLRLLISLSIGLILVGCGRRDAEPTPLPPTQSAPTATAGVTATTVAAATPSLRATKAPPTATPLPNLIFQPDPLGHAQPTLADFWDGDAEFLMEVTNTGLPMGESETILMSNGELWSYVHASDQSAGVVDQCGDPVSFPGCLVIYRSTDGGHSFNLDQPVCRIACNQCPCTSEGDHIDQQQYPRVAWDGKRLHLVYEYRAMIMEADSTDGYNWTPVGQVPLTGIWQYWFRDCSKAESIGVHPNTPYYYQCLVGGPPGIFYEDNMLYIFVGSGQNPGAMGCYKGSVDTILARFEKCAANPLFGGADSYGPPDLTGPQANPFFDFRTISSADVQKIGDRYYMLYEGVRGPTPGAGGDTQFGLGLARSLTDQIDGPWETYPANPILVDMPGNVGVGHADLAVIDGRTILYTSLDGKVRSRLALRWK